MASPTFFRHGNTPNVSDSKWMILQRILGAIIDGGGGGSGTGGAGLVGTGSPEGTVTADAGTTYADNTNPGAPSLWYKMSGSGNVGWVQLIA